MSDLKANIKGGHSEAAAYNISEVTLKIFDQTVQMNILQRLNQIMSKTSGISTTQALTNIKQSYTKFILDLNIYFLVSEVLEHCISTKIDTGYWYVGVNSQPKITNLTWWQIETGSKNITSKTFEILSSLDFRDDPSGGDYKQQHNTLHVYFEESE